MVSLTTRWIARNLLIEEALEPYTPLTPLAVMSEKHAEQQEPLNP